MAGAFDRIRTDQVGSLLRPEALKSAWAEFDRGELDERDLAVIQAEAVAEVIESQVSLGIFPVTDGEFWRRGFQETFVNAVSGYSPLGESASSAAEAGGHVESGSFPRLPTSVDRPSPSESGCRRTAFSRSSCATSDSPIGRSR
jgi:methionine synthase II (cobalamin-independent)